LLYDADDLILLNQETFVHWIKLQQIFVRLSVTIHHIVKAVWKESTFLTLRFKKCRFNASCVMS